MFITAIHAHGAKQIIQAACKRACQQTKTKKRKIALTYVIIFCFTLSKCTKSR